MKKRSVALLLSFALVLSGLPMNARAEEIDSSVDFEGELAVPSEAEFTQEEITDDNGYALEVNTVSTVSGNLMVPKPTKMELYENYQNNIVKKTYKDKFSVIPSIKSPYSLGVLYQNYLDSGLGYINFARYAAGLEDVKLGTNENTSAQTGAVLLAANNSLTHTPSKPSNMDQAFYNAGLAATTTSNIGSGYTGFSTFMQGCLNDSDAGNIPMLGHRRWLLNPKLGTVGLGNAGNYYTAKIQDISAASVDYNFISWPASGNFPSELLPVASVAWSVTLNPAKFKTYSAANISVVITRRSDNKKVTLTAADSGNAAYAAKEFFNVNTTGYGVANVISFRPGTDAFGTGTLKGVYNVSIQGLLDAAGNAAAIDYDVDFFSAKDYGKVDLARIGSFVERLYQLCLGRNSDTNGFDNWVNNLVEGDFTGAMIGDAFVFSNEYKARNTSDEEFIQMLYKAFLGRNADEGGMNYWKSCLNDGVSRKHILKGFIESTEYDGICKACGISRGNVNVTEPRDFNINITRYVKRLYQCILGREYDVDGLNSWCYEIYSKNQTPQKAAANFLAAPEFLQKNTSDDEYINVLYRTYFGREADDSGRIYWTGKLQNGATRNDVRDGFADSVEFKNIMAQFGL